MDERVIRLLEFDKVRRMLAEQASFSLGKELALALRPSTRLFQASRWQEETEQARRLLEKRGRAPFGGLTDIRAVVRRAGKGAVLRPEELLAVADAVRAFARLRAYFASQGAAEDAPDLADLAESLGTFTRIEREISRCIDQEGHVVDHASPELAKIRARLRTERRRAREYLERLIRSPHAQRYLQEPIVTLRNGRYVVPVKQEHRGEVPGIVHDQSASGATLYIEPMPVVEANNEVRKAERDEAAEVERILAAISQLVAADEDALVHSVEMAGELDFICAKAALAVQWDAVRPALNEEGYVRLVRARHPLLTGQVVPIDLHLGREFTALIITGPNTGGKTVTLKTVGLFCLMAQAGLQLPADPGTEIAVFRSVFADIGDEQSIEQSLSTFSSHMGNIVAILRQVDASSLVLLDELGAGTDPTEGAALAIALLEHLCDRVGCRVVATTHYSELKSFAYTHPACENASVEFDVETLRPTYRLSIGVAGQSNAFAIAARLGLDSGIIARAQRELTEEERYVNDLLRSVEADRRAAQRERAEAERLRQRYEELAVKYHEAFEKLKAAREEVLAEARREASALVQRAQREAERLLGRLRRAGQSALEERAAKVRERLGQIAQSLEAEEATPPPRSEGGAALASLYIGAPVYVRSLGQVGEIAQLMGDGRVAVRLGAMRVTVEPHDLEGVKEEAAPPRRPAATGYAHLAREKAAAIATELDLRGSLVEEALEKVDKYLDDATLASVKAVRIIHGKGTGALREAIQSYLAADPRVSAYRLGDPSEGGSGVTVVTLHGDG